MHSFKRLFSLVGTVILILQGLSYVSGPRGGVDEKDALESLSDAYELPRVGTSESGEVLVYDKKECFWVPFKPAARENLDQIVTREGEYIIYQDNKQALIRTQENGVFGSSWIHFEEDESSDDGWRRETVYSEAVLADGGTTGEPMEVISGHTLTAAVEEFNLYTGDGTLSGGHEITIPIDYDILTEKVIEELTKRKLKLESHE